MLVNIFFKKDADKIKGCRTYEANVTPCGNGLVNIEIVAPRMEFYNVDLYNSPMVQVVQWGDPATVLEQTSEDLEIRLDQYAMANGKISQEVIDFVTWCVNENKQDMDVPRNPDGKSFRERREAPIVPLYPDHEIDLTSGRCVGCGESVERIRSHGYTCEEFQKNRSCPNS
jgi:hypothetical protein